MLLVTEANYGNEMVGLLRAVFHLVQDWPRKKEVRISRDTGQGVFCRVQLTESQKKCWCLGWVVSVNRTQRLLLSGH